MLLTHDPSTATTQLAAGELSCPSKGCAGRLGPWGHAHSPLLYQVATTGLSADDIAPNLRGIVQRDLNVEARMATVRGLDLDRHEVLVDAARRCPTTT